MVPTPAAMGALTLPEVELRRCEADWAPAHPWLVVGRTLSRALVLCRYHTAREHRIKGLGPAFGTKFIAFCQPAGARPAALIHDQLVGAWLAAHGRPDLASASWSLPRYEAYLDQIHVWADALGVDPETVEYLIFQAEADARGTQWATRR